MKTFNPTLDFSSRQSFRAERLVPCFTSIRRYNLQAYATSTFPIFQTGFHLVDLQFKIDPRALHPIGGNVSVPYRTESNIRTLEFEEILDTILVCPKIDPARSFLLHPPVYRISSISLFGHPALGLMNWSDLMHGGTHQGVNCSFFAKKVIMSISSFFHADFAIFSITHLNFRYKFLYECINLSLVSPGISPRHLCNQFLLLRVLNLAEIDA